MNLATPITKTIAYHPGQNTVIEFWEEDGSFIALLPSGERVFDRNAAEVLNAVTFDEDVLVRKVNCRDK